MSLTLYYHPLASYCHNALIALYENGTPFRPCLVDLGDPADRAAFASVWPPPKFPVLQDESAGRTVPESSIVIEYLETHYPGPARLIPIEPEAALEVRLLVRQAGGAHCGSRVGRREPFHARRLRGGAGALLW